MIAFKTLTFLGTQLANDSFLVEGRTPTDVLYSSLILDFTMVVEDTASNLYFVRITTVR